MEDSTLSSVGTSHLWKSRKKRVAIILSVCLVFGILLFIYINFLRNKTVTPPANYVVARVGKEDIYQSYITKEEELYPGKITPEVKRTLIDKVIRDSIILQSAYKEGLMPNAFGQENPTKEEYLKRLHQVKRIETYIKTKSDGILGHVVTLRFYNDGYIGPKGLEGSQKIANEKITSLYQRVKSKQITINQAAQLIADDTSLKDIDPSYKSPIASIIYGQKGEKITSWPIFDELLWKTKEGEVTPLYLGKDQYNGKMIDALYMFALVSEKNENTTYESFSQWFNNHKKEYKIVYIPTPTNDK